MFFRTVRLAQSMIDHGAAMGHKSAFYHHHGKKR